MSSVGCALEEVLDARSMAEMRSAICELEEGVGERAWIVLLQTPTWNLEMAKAAIENAQDIILSPTSFDDHFALWALGGMIKYNFRNAPAPHEDLRTGRHVPIAEDRLGNMPPAFAERIREYCNRPSPPGRATRASPAHERLHRMEREYAKGQFHVSQ